MIGKLKKYRQIKDIETDPNSNLGTLSIIAKRGLVPIAVIDDETFSPCQNLENNGYKIEIIGDLKSIDQILNYNIILCDLQGVGRLLNAKTQGAFIIDEIKRNHPEKFVIAYTGGSSDDQITQLAQKSADFFLKKDADIEDWRDKLDEIISFLSNPVSVWRRQRFALIDADVPTLDILKLEDAFVKAIKDRSSDSYKKILGDSKVNSDLRAIAQSLVASGIFKVIVGS